MRAENDTGFGSVDDFAGAESITKENFSNRQ